MADTLSFHAQDWLTFLELKPFSRRWAELKLTDQDLRRLQLFLITDPRAGDVIEGTGGVRKLRFAIASLGRGKSGGVRICYAYFEKHFTVVLAMVYTKKEKLDLTPAEKSILRNIMNRVEKSLPIRAFTPRTK